MTADDPRLTSGIQNLLQEYSRSVQIHTDWQGYSENACYDAVEDGFIEFRRAVMSNITEGPHCKSTEALQLAVVALKAHLYFATNKGEPS